MLRRDLILVMIEEIGKAIAQMKNNRNDGDTRKNVHLIEDAYISLKTDPAFLLSSSPEEICNSLNQEDNEGLQRMELTAKVLLEESYLYPEKQKEMRRKVKQLLEYIQANDTTFSLERISLIQELNHN